MKYRKEAAVYNLNFPWKSQLRPGFSEKSFENKWAPGNLASCENSSNHKNRRLYKATVFCGIDLNAFYGNFRAGQFRETLHAYSWGAILWKNMKDSNGHTISKKQQNKYLKMGEQLAITYTLDSIDSNKSSTEYAKFHFRQ